MAVTEVTCPHVDLRQVEVQTVRRVLESSIGEHGEWVTFKGAPHVVASVTTYECGSCGWTQSRSILNDAKEWPTKAGCLWAERGTAWGR